MNNNWNADQTFKGVPEELITSLVKVLSKNVILYELLSAKHVGIIGAVI